jgi:hypothetical protein
MKKSKKVKYLKILKIMQFGTIACNTVMAVWMIEKQDKHIIFEAILDMISDELKKENPSTKIVDYLFNQLKIRTDEKF